MPRPVSTTLSSLLPSAITHETVEIMTRSGSVHKYLASDYITIGAQDYDGYVRRVGDLTETLGAATNGLAIKVQNIDYEFGTLAASDSRTFELADVTIKRFYEDPANPAAINEHKFLFAGKAVKATTTEKSVEFDVIPDTTAAGYCLAVETLSPSNGWIFPGVSTSSVASGASGVGSGELPPPQSGTGGSAGAYGEPGGGISPIYTKDGGGVNQIFY